MSDVNATPVPTVTTRTITPSPEIMEIIMYSFEYNGKKYTFDPFEVLEKLAEASEKADDATVFAKFRELIGDGAKEIPTSLLIAVFKDVATNVREEAEQLKKDIEGFQTPADFMAATHRGM